MHILLLYLFFQQILGENCYWIAGDNSWDTALNWDCNKVPSDSDTAIFNNTLLHYQVNTTSNVRLSNLTIDSPHLTLFINGNLAAQTLQITQGNLTVLTANLNTVFIRGGSFKTVTQKHQIILLRHLSSVQSRLK